MRYRMPLWWLTITFIFADFLAFNNPLTSPNRQAHSNPIAFMGTLKVLSLFVLWHNTVPLPVFIFICSWPYRALKVTASLDTTVESQRRLPNVTWPFVRCDIIVSDLLRCCQTDSSVHHVIPSYLSNCLGRVVWSIVLANTRANALTNSSYFFFK